MSNKTKSNTKGAFGGGRRTNGIKLDKPAKRKEKAKSKAMKAQGFRKKG